MSETKSPQESIQLISDIHLEFDDTYKLKHIVMPKSPNLAICGDLGIPYLPTYAQFIDDVSKLFERVFIVLGNHEFYQWKKSGEKLTIEQTYTLVENIVKPYENVYLLNNSAIEFEDFVVIGSTLWSNIPKSKFSSAVQGMNDFKNIYKTPRLKISPMDFNTLHDESVNKLEALLTQHKEKKTIVLTHYLPSFKITDATPFKDSKLNCCFASDLDRLMHDNIVAWLAGHTHCSVQVEKYHVNPMGYDGENINYNNSYVIKLK